MSQLLHNVHAWLLDLDGTTYISNTPQPGAVELCNWFVQQHIPYFFFTNNPTRDAAAYAEHLTHIGISTTPNQIITSAQATIAYLIREQLRRVYAVGTPHFTNELHAAGVTHTTEQPQAVVISFDTTLTYDKLKTAALLLLHNPDIPYIATNPDYVCPTSEGPIPDCGALIAALHAATNRTPLVIGKPERGMVDLASERSGVSIEHLGIIGDRLYTDIAIGANLDITTVLVLNGETTPQMLAKSTIHPSISVHNLHELLLMINIIDKTV